MRSLLKDEVPFSFPTQVFKILQLTESHKNSNIFAISKQACIISMSAAKSLHAGKIPPETMPQKINPQQLHEDQEKYNH